MEFVNQEDKKKETYTKEESQFIDNISIALTNGIIFNNVHGHLLRIHGINNINESYKDIMYNMTEKQFDELQEKFYVIISKSVDLSILYRELVLDINVKRKFKNK